MALKVLLMFFLINSVVNATENNKSEAPTKIKQKICDIDVRNKDLSYEDQISQCKLECETLEMVW